MLPSASVLLARNFPAPHGKGAETSQPIGLNKMLSGWSETQWTYALQLLPGVDQGISEEELGENCVLPQACICAQNWEVNLRHPGRVPTGPRPTDA